MDDAGIEATMRSFAQRDYDLIIGIGFAMADAVKSGQVAGYGADVLDPEPVQLDNPLLGLHNVHLTPHVGSRTYESVVRQGSAAVENLIRSLQGHSVAKVQSA
jgi:phosphoglycerate dehydrogenase-like enzyme